MCCEVDFEARKTDGVVDMDVYAKGGGVDKYVYTPSYINNNIYNRTDSDTNVHQDTVTPKLLLTTFNRIKKMYVPNSKGHLTVPSKVSTKVRMAMLKKVGIEVIEDTMDKAFRDPWHKESDYKWVTLEYCTRDTTINKYYELR